MTTCQEVALFAPVGSISRSIISMNQDKNFAMGEQIRSADSSEECGIVECEMPPGLPSTVTNYHGSELLLLALRQAYRSIGNRKFSVKCEYR